MEAADLWKRIRHLNHKLEMAEERIVDAATQVDILAAQHRSDIQRIRDAATNHPQPYVCLQNIRQILDFFDSRDCAGRKAGMNRD